MLLTQIHKLETAISWHLAQGALQDASVLQLLVNTAAADGNVAVLSMLLPLFERMGWLVSRRTLQMSYRFYNRTLKPCMPCLRRQFFRHAGLTFNLRLCRDSGAPCFLFPMS